MKWSKADGLLALAIVAFIASQITLMRILGPIANEGLMLQLTFSAQDFAGVVTSWNGEELQRYLDHLRFDFIHLVIYGFTLWWGVYRLNTLTPLEPLMRKILFSAPIIAALLDAAENSLHWFMLNNTVMLDEAITQPWVAIAATAAWIKWVLALGTLAFLVWRLPRAYFLNR